MDFFFLNCPTSLYNERPCWIDYTDFTLNGSPMLTSHKTVWHDKPYTLTIAIKDTDVIEFAAAWRTAFEAAAEKITQVLEAQKKQAKKLAAELNNLRASRT